MENVVPSLIELGLPFKVSDLVYKFRMICLRGTLVIEQKTNVEHTDGRTDIYMDGRTNMGKT